MSASEDIVIVDSSDYAQVIFEDVKESFTNVKPLECVFTLNDLLKSGNADEWIGIYKVGFSNCAEYVCKLPVEMVNENKGKLIFSIEDLPKEDGEFYQFVYVSNAKQIRGASVPFQFKIEECTEFSDDEEDAVIVKFETNDTYNDIKTQCVKLESSNQTYEKIVRENEDLIKTLKDEVASIKLRCFRLTMDNEKLNFTLRNKADSLKNLAETITGITNDNDNLQSRFNDVSNENKILLDQLQERLDQINSLKAEFETAKNTKREFGKDLLQLEKDKDELNRIVEELNLINDQIQKLETQVIERTDELDKIKLDLRNNNASVIEQTETIKIMVQDREKMSQLIEELMNEKNATKVYQEEILQELNMTKEKLNASEQCKEMLRAQLEIGQSEIDGIKQKMSSEYKDLADKLAQNQFDQTDNDKKIEQIKAEHIEEINQLNGTMFVLRSAHTHLENRLKTSEQRKELSIEKENETNKKLNSENEELKERIRYGAIEYAKLHEKYRLLKNQKFNIEMNMTNQTEENQLTRRRAHINSTQNDSAIQEKTVSQSARASAVDSENTLLDALLGSSFYNGGWNGNSPKDQSTSTQDKKQIKQLKELTSSKTTPIETTPATTTQPKSSQASDFSSDDGLIHFHNKNTETQSNLSEKIRRCQIGPQSIEPKNENCENCEVCGYVFSTDVNKSEREQHYTNHFGPSCPVCFLQFRKGYPQKDFEMHVNSHFTN